jgi:hypothetical protein
MGIRASKMVKRRDDSTCSIVKTFIEGLHDYLWDLDAEEQIEIRFNTFCAFIIGII